MGFGFWVLGLGFRAARTVHFALQASLVKTTRPLFCGIADPKGNCNRCQEAIFSSLLCTRLLKLIEDETVSAFMLPLRQRV